MMSLLVAFNSSDYHAQLFVVHPTKALIRKQCPALLKHTPISQSLSERVPWKFLWFEQKILRADNYNSASFLTTSNSLPSHPCFALQCRLTWYNPHSRHLYLYLKRLFFKMNSKDIYSCKTKCALNYCCQRQAVFGDTPRYNLYNVSQSLWLLWRCLLYALISSQDEKKQCWLGLCWPHYFN